MLEKLEPYFHIGVFTAGQQPYADWVIKRIDPNETHFKFRFYRESCLTRGNFQVKDLGLVKRHIEQSHPELFRNIDDPFSRMVIVDNINESF